MSGPLERIKLARKLLDIGEITEEEFSAIKAEAMSEMGMSTTPPPSAPSVGGDTRVLPPSVSSGVGEGTIIGDVVTSSGSPETDKENIEIGQYQVLDLLGEGGMGSVYLGRHKNEVMAEAQGNVAIKLIKPELAKNEHLRNRFIKEAALGIKLSHPNIADVIAFHEDENQIAFIMEFIEGEELKALIPENGLSLEEALQHLQPIAEAVDFLHQKGVIHRDLKPANIKIRPDGTPVILDFGIAKEQNSESSSMTQTGTTMGTEAYMAPEQFNAKSVGPRADQYSFAMMTYQLLSGRLPWDAQTTSQMIAVAKVTNALKPLHECTDIDAVYSEALMKGLSLDAEKRYGSCVEFVAAIRDAKENHTKKSEEDARKAKEESIRVEAQAIQEKAIGLGLSLPTMPEDITELAAWNTSSNERCQTFIEEQKKKELLEKKEALLEEEKSKKQKQEKVVPPTVPSSSTRSPLLLGVAAIALLGFGALWMMSGTESSNIKTGVVEPDKKTEEIVTKNTFSYARDIPSLQSKKWKKVSLRTFLQYDPPSDIQEELETPSCAPHAIDCTLSSEQAKNLSVPLLYITEDGIYGQKDAASAYTKIVPFSKGMLIDKDLKTGLSIDPLFEHLNPKRQYQDRIQSKFEAKKEIEDSKAGKEKAIDNFMSGLDFGADSTEKQDTSVGKLILAVSPKADWNLIRDVMFTAGKAEFYDFFFLTDVESCTGESCSGANQFTVAHNPSLSLPNLNEGDTLVGFRSSLPAIVPAGYELPEKQTLRISESNNIVCSRTLSIVSSSGAKKKFTCTGEKCDFSAQEWEPIQSFVDQQSQNEELFISMLPSSTFADMAKIVSLNVNLDTFFVGGLGGNRNIFSSSRECIPIQRQYDHRFAELEKIQTSYNTQIQSCRKKYSNDKELSDCVLLDVEEKNPISLLQSDLEKAYTHISDEQEANKDCLGNRFTSEIKALSKQYTNYKNQPYSETEIADITSGKSIYMTARQLHYEIATAASICPPSEPAKRKNRSIAKEVGLGSKGMGRGRSGRGMGGGSFGKKRKRGSLVRIGGAPTILGGLDKTLIDAVIKRNMAQVRYCYQKQLAKNPSLKGKIKVKFVIAKDGSVSRASIDSSTMGGARKAVESCIVGRFKKFKFPKPSGGIVIVKYPFIFSPD